ncbi:hypothetical protein EIP91_011409 [Steccherinum ochraceum]|uniref:F-box domain-containing protein n=1 Tax=Steccherinum ochraceum TaxID=92696 RepID=A0A4R0R1U8_9APHY|nr:hypothetical protein EIP91_011409 [Steccherinum ochraceum]
MKMSFVNGECNSVDVARALHYDRQTLLYSKTLIRSSETLPTVLDWDVLIYALSYVEDKAYQSRFMRTCRTLYNAGIPVLMSGELSIGWDMNNLSDDPGLALTDSFCCFIEKDPRRALHIRHMYFRDSIAEQYSFMDIEEEEEALLERLRRVIGHCKNLKKLKIDLAEAFFSALGFAATVGSLPNLESIELSNAGRAAVAAIRKFTATAPITHASIAFDKDDIEDEEVIGNIRFPELLCDPIAAFGPIRNHLVHLHVDLEPEYSVDDFNSYALALSCPNLRSFDWITWDPIDIAPEFAEAARKRNEKSPLQWTWSMALPCTVKYWEEVTLSYREQFPRFWAILSQLRPTHLQLSIVMESLPTAVLSEVVRSTTVTHLWVRMALVNCAFRPAFTVQTMLLKLLSNLRTLPLAFLVIELDYANQDTLDADRRRIRELYGVREPGRPLERPKEDRLDIALATLDIDAAARKVASTSPGLKRLFIRFSRGQRKDAAWEIIRNKEGSTSSGDLRALEEVDALEILRASVFKRHFADSS